MLYQTCLVMIDSLFFLAIFIPSFTSSNMIFLGSISSISDSPNIWRPPGSKPVSAEHHAWWPPSMLFGHFSLAVCIWLKLTHGHPEDADPLTNLCMVFLDTRNCPQARATLISWLYFSWCHLWCKITLCPHENRPGPELTISRGDKYCHWLNSIQSHSRNKHTFLSGAERYTFRPAIRCHIDALRVMVY